MSASPSSDPRKSLIRSLVTGAPGRKDPVDVMKHSMDVLSPRLIGGVHQPCVQGRTPLFNSGPGGGRIRITSWKMSEVVEMC